MKRTLLAAACVILVASVAAALDGAGWDTGGRDAPLQTGPISMTDTLDAATGNETVLALTYTVNKATSGNDYGLLITATTPILPARPLALPMSWRFEQVFCR